MEVVEQEKLYKSAKSKIETLEVITQPEDISKYCKDIAALLKKAGNYKDAQELAKKYEELSVKKLEEGKKLTYDRAVKILDQADSVSDYDRGLSLLHTVEGYGDAKEAYDRYREKKLAFIKKSNVKFGIRAVILAAAVAAAGFFGNQWLNKKNQESKNSASQTELLGGAEPGDEVSFGKYTWKVLDKTGDRVKLMATHIDAHEELNQVSFHGERTEVAWEDSDIRAWLNGAFLEEGFSEEERALLLETELENPQNETYETKGGADTADRVYLLSEQETKYYWKYVQQMGFNFLLRTPGNAADTAAYVSSDHKLMSYGVPVDEELSIRPVIEVALEENSESDLSQAKVGDKITFGGMNWKILDADDEQILVISVNSDTYPALTDRSYHDEQTAVAWKDSSLRRWLNEEFPAEQFTEEERSRILLTQNEDTEDSVYLLSAEEVNAYWSELESMSLNWILRTPGENAGTVSYVSSDHEINSYGCAVTDPMYVRPVMHIAR